MNLLASAAPEACLLELSGRVQGVGFRPFVYRLARQTGVRGWVLNGAGRVHIFAEGDPEDLDRFARGLVDAAPAAARPQLDSRSATLPEGHRGFEIRYSEDGEAPRICVPPDQFACDECLSELQDPADRRYCYPFINCTQCGPRYTIITALPYDRPNTSMRSFELCPACRSEYEDPADRRFHAQPLACPACGPALSWSGPGDAADPLDNCVAALRAGCVTAVRGIGGYHLVCDPTREAAVAALRERKHRPHKPLAVMVPESGDDRLDGVRAIARPDTLEAAALLDPSRPIVLVKCREGALAAGIAPGLEEIGVMLPYSPLHHRLLTAFGGPLVATSGNLSGEPVLTDCDDAARRLGGIADGFLHHDRPIVRPADDPVCRRIGDLVRPIRLGRGNAPLEFSLRRHLARPILAVGAFMKNTVAIAADDRVIISPHVGELASPRSRRVFEQVVEDLCALYRIEPASVACDAHPDYPNSRWARQLGLPLIEVFHHHAHAAAAWAEQQGDDPILCFTWDGTGLGPDGTIWGGELLRGRPGEWHRVGSLRPFRLPGGERAATEGWRAALGLAWEAGLPEVPRYDARQDLVRQAWERGMNAPLTTSAGRLLDAAAALVGLRRRSSFEGQAPMALEAAARNAGPADPVELPFSRDETGVDRIDWAPLLPLLADSAIPPGARAAALHESLALAMTAQALRCADEIPIRRVALSGGVFQNRILSERLTALLTAAGMDVLHPARVPVNDAGISLGQVIEASARQELHP